MSCFHKFYSKNVEFSTKKANSQKLKHHWSWPNKVETSSCNVHIICDFFQISEIIVPYRKQRSKPSSFRRPSLYVCQLSLHQAIVSPLALLNAINLLNSVLTTSAAASCWSLVDRRSVEHVFFITVTCLIDTRFLGGRRSNIVGNIVRLFFVAPMLRLLHQKTINKWINVTWIWEIIYEMINCCNKFKTNQVGK